MSKKELKSKNLAQNDEGDGADDDDEEDADYAPELDEEQSDEEEDDAADGGDEDVNDEEKESSNKRPLKRKSNAKEDTEDAKKTKLGSENDIFNSKKAEDIWSSFKKDVNTKKVNETPTSSSNSIKKYDSNNLNVNSKFIESNEASVGENKIKKYFSESAIMSIKNSISSTQPINQISDEGAKKPIGKPSGLAGLLGKLEKKNEPSTLTKSKLDWEEFKKNEDIEEDLASHSKGKKSYLERQAFLGRVDNRQFEIEKSFRTKERASRDSIK